MDPQVVTCQAVTEYATPEEWQRAALKWLVARKLWRPRYAGVINAISKHIHKPFGVVTSDMLEEVSPDKRVRSEILGVLWHKGLLRRRRGANKWIYYAGDLDE